MPTPTPKQPHPSSSSPRHHNDTTTPPSHRESVSRDPSPTTKTDEDQAGRRRTEGDLLSFQEREDRERAAAVLRSWECCAWLGEGRGEVSLHCFLLCGLDGPLLELLYPFRSSLQTEIITTRYCGFLSLLSLRNGNFRGEQLASHSPLPHSPKPHARPPRIT